jgi:hypothetical protein
MSELLTVTLETTPELATQLVQLQNVFAEVCNATPVSNTNVSAAGIVSALRIKCLVANASVEGLATKSIRIPFDVPLQIVIKLTTVFVEAGTTYTFEFVLATPTI